MDQANISNRPNYTAEYLSELKASTSAPPVRKHDESMDIDGLLEPDEIADALGFTNRDELPVTSK